MASIICLVPFWQPFTIHILYVLYCVTLLAAFHNSQTLRIILCYVICLTYVYFQ